MSKTLTRDVLSKHKKDYNTFIETGTYAAGAVDLAFNCGFEKVYTIDISTKHKNEFHQKYQKQIAENKLKFLYGESFLELEKLFKYINYPCVIWHDAHYDMHSDVCGKYECPILEELEVIKNSGIKNHILIIDDIRIFKSQTYWAKDISFEKILHSLNKINSNYEIFYEDGYEPNDILIAKPK